MQAEQLELPRDHTIPAVNATQLLPYRALLSQYCYNSLINFKFAKTAVNQVGTTDRVTADTPFIGELENNENFPLTDRGLTLPTIVTLVLLTVLAALVAGASPAFAQGTVPEAPDQPIGTAVFVGGVDLEWNDVPGADSYDVQLYRNGQWLDLPGDGVEIAFYGAGAIISGLDPNSTLWFQVRAKNAQGFSDWSNVSSMASTNQFRLGRRARPANVPASGAPVINGTAQVGESLTADTTGIEDGNGLDRVQFRFQWATNDGSADTAIAGATDSTYTLAASDEGKTIKVRVAFTDRGGYAESLTSAATATVAAASNSPATGAPVISGTAEVGNTLTADTSDIADADGLVNATYSYQWVANNGTSDTDITGGTDSTYTLVAADEGKIIKVKVSFTDDAGNGETLTSAVTAEVAARPNSPATAAPTISGTTQVGEALTADISGIGDADGLTNVSYSHQWIRNDGSSDTSITDATDSTYTLVDADEGKTIKVKVSFTDDADNEETLTSAATSSVAARPNNPATGGPTISGTAQVGETLTANTSGIADTDGLTNVSYSHRWIRNDGTSDADIENATGSSYTLVDADEGQTIKVEVSFTDDAGYDETLTSAATAAVEARPNSAATGAPAISGTAQVGETLTADTSGIADDDGLNNVSYSYQWIANDGTADTDIQDATGPTYTLVSADEGKTIKVRVSFTDDGANEETLTSTATEAVSFAVQQQIANSPATGAPAVSGTAQVGKTLTADTTGIADTDGLTNVSFSYQWIVNDGTSDTDIQDATDSTYTLAAADEGKTIKVRVSFTDDATNEESLASAATGAVAAAPPSYITVFVTDDRSDPNNIVTNFTVTWSDSGDCSTNYNAYLNIEPGTRPGHETPGSQLHLGSAPSDGAQITKGLTGIQGSSEGSYVELYCGTDGSGRSVSIVGIPGIFHPMPSTYSSAPLTALTISSGTLSPDFDRGIYLYTAEVPSDVALITLNPVVLTGFQTDIVKDPSGYVGRACSTACYAWVYGDGTTYGIVLSDADTSTDGFQVNLDPGENRLLISVHKGPARSNFPRTYNLAVTVQNSPATSQNSPATGAPTISGTAQVGETLTADTSGIADEDGLDNATFSYQWLSSRDTAISGATGSTHTLVSTDLGKIIKVKVTFTDDEGNEESLTSSPTASVADSSNNPATGSPAISGTAQVGQTLTASTSGIADDDGLTNVSYTYQWIANDGISDSDIQDATLSTYTLVSDDVGKTIKVKVSFTDDAENEETLTSAATDSVVTVANPIAGICDRTEQVQDAILGWLNGVDDCADVTGSHLAGITIGLRISSNDPYDRPALSLKPGDFAGLVNIEELAIYYHTMDALPEDIFNGLGSLERLYLSSNDIAALPEDVFDGLGNLVRLDLEGTHLSALPEDVFDGLGNLESLDLRRNQIGTLPENVFDGLGNLVRLDLSSNDIAALPEGVFDGLGSLESLELFGNRINALPEDVFDGLGSLTFLRLSFNQLSALPDDVFDDLGNLVHLDMQENQIGTLPEGVYNGLSSLERLDLSYNEIAALPGDVFDGLGNLKSLRLDSNDLASPPEDVFDGLDSLGHLALSHNRIHTLPEDVFEGLGNLTYLALNTNQISVLPEDIFDELGNLTSLALDSNQLGALPEGVFDELGNLTSLGLGGNRIGPLAEDFFDELGNLTLLDLSSNGLGAVPEGFFDELGNLTFLGLHRNQIRALPEDVFDGLSNLEQLYLFENQLGALPEDVFDGLGNLNILYLYGNQLSALPEDVFDGLSNLNELYLYRNQLSALPEDVFDGLSNLNELYLWGNPGTPFTLTADLERQGDNAVLVKVAEGVPFDMEVTLSATGGTLSAASVTIKGGTAGSEAVTVTRSSDGPVTVSVASAVFQAGDYNGIQAGLGEPLILGDAEGYNRPATGTPAISDAVQVGETLTVDTSGIADEDGLDNVSYSYQWLSSRDTEIDGATGSTYTLQGTDLGKIIKVRVTFTDDAGNEETLTSAATDAVEARPNSPATGDPTISGAAEVGETLTADTSGIADADGLTNVTYSYQWIANDGTSDTDITDATDSTYTLVADDDGKTIKVNVSFADDAGGEETLTSTATGEVAAAAPTEPPGIPRNLTGTANADGTVTLRWDAPNDDSVTGYQILRRRPREGENTLLVLVNDTGSTATEYTDNDVTPDVGHAYRVKAINAVGLGRQSKFVNVTPTQPAGPAQNNPATGTPTISGTAQVGETLTADTSGIGDDDGLANVTFSYQWIASDGAVDIDITSATVSSYTPVDADEGQTIQVQVSFTDDAGNDESLTSAVTAPVPARPNTPATGAPTIGGTAQVGETLTADTSGIADADGLTNVTYSYQWLGDDTDIAGATSSTYTLAETDEGKTIKLRVSFTDDRGNSETGTSAATAVVAVPEPPAKPTGLSAVVVSHDTVTLTWDDPQDDTITGYVILRRDREIHPTGTFVTIAGDTGSADTTYTDDTVEPDKEYVYRIKAINEHGEVSEISNWVRADTPAAPSPAG